MQPSATAKNVPARKRIIGDNVLARLECEPCWTNEGKDKNELETFLYKHLFTMARKGMWHSELGLFVCTAGKARNLWGAAKGKQFYKRRQNRFILLQLL